jgi:hypothetical protein
METETPLVDAVVATPVCAFGYCSEELYNRGCLEGFENMWICNECKFELQKIKEGEEEKLNELIVEVGGLAYYDMKQEQEDKIILDRLNLLQRIETIKNNNYGFTIGKDKYSRIFGRNELIEIKDFKVNMEVPIIPLNCLCGCSHKLDFTLDKQTKRFENKGNYKCFFNAKHITTFKKEHHF